MPDAKDITYTHSGTGAVQRTVKDRLDETVSVLDFMSPALIGRIQTGQWTNPDVSAVTAAIQAAIGSLNSGGTIFFPAGVYPVSQIVIDRSSHDIDGIVLAGAGSTNSTILASGNAGDYAIAANFSGRFGAFSLKNMCIAGTPDRLRCGLSMRMVMGGKIEDVQFQHLDVCMRGAHAYGMNFDSLVFKDYNIGVRGITPSEAQQMGLDYTGAPLADDVFTNCYWFDGNRDGTAIAVQDHAMNSNKFINCTFAGTNLTGLDLTHSYGGNLFFGCRFERMKAGSSWLSLNSYNRFYGCAAYTDGVNIWGNNAGGGWLFDIYGCSNYIDGVSPAYPWRIFNLRPGSTQNDVRWNPSEGGSAGWLSSTYFVEPIRDAGTRNLIHVGGQDHLCDRVNAWSDRCVLNMLLTNCQQTCFTLDGVTRTSRASLPGSMGGGPVEVGFVYGYDAPTGNRRAWASVGGLTPGYFYTFSMWVAATDTQALGRFEIIAGNNLAENTAYSDVQRLPVDNVWYRISKTFKATGASGVCGFRIPVSVGSNGLLVALPQFIECGNLESDIIIGGFIPTSDSIVSELAPDFAKTRKLPSPPDGGWHSRGEFVHNLSPVELGTAGSRYVVGGWLRLTNGRGNVFNVDWVATRLLTGN